MSKRIFTKYMGGAVADVGAFPAVENAIATWLLQEDIEVIGFSLGVESVIGDQNDNLGEIIGELSQSGVFGQDGVIGQVHGAHFWNSVPASVDRECPTTIAMFPQGTAVPVKEEGHLYLNANIKGAVATHNEWYVRAIVYYTKKGK